jgi:beta-phosphoglucomutase-like phosphatase (HAD superfamily)
MNSPFIDPRAAALIFDLDGTLADSLPLHNACWIELCNSFNYRYDPKKMFKMTGMPTRKFAEYIKKDSNCKLSVEELMQAKQQLFLNKAHTIKPFEAIATFIKDNYGKIPMSIGTGGSRKSAQTILKAIDMTQYFEFVVTSDDVDNHKPNPDTFLKCAVLMNIEPSKCQVFEDGEPGMAAAEKAGMIVTDVNPFIFNKTEI